ncbi:MAG: hypothetical protein PVJ15_06105 [Gammaproteobacteria bacterium]
MINTASTICKMARIRLALTMVLILAATAWGRDVPVAATIPSQAAIEAAIARGFDWITQHPATLQDGGLPDILDEGVGFLVLYNLAPDSARKARFAAQLQERVATLERLPEFAQWVNRQHKPLIDHYHLVLAAHLVRRTGKPAGFQPRIVSLAQQALAAAPQADPTLRLTIALLLDHLGENPGISLRSALSGSRIERIARGYPPALPEADAPQWSSLLASYELYALVHEIIAWTDFGALPLAPWLAERRDALVRFLVDAVDWAVAEGDVDLASELLVSIRFLKQPLDTIRVESLGGILRLLVERQQPDGSWGDCPTQRQNKVRHAAYTATTALWIYLNTPAE